MMNKVNNKSIFLTLALLAILALGSFTPKSVEARIEIDGYRNRPYANFIPAPSVPEPVSPAPTTVNPSPAVYNAVPVITSINPNSANPNQGSTLVNITGYNFTHGSVARWNSSDRATVYIDSNHLSVRLTDADISGKGQYLITVFNPGPGGGFSNSVVFNIGDTAITNGAVPATTTENTNSLGASAIGAGSFFPASLVGWLILGICILLAVILWRRLYTEKDKHAPLKHA